MPAVARIVVEIDETGAVVGATRIEGALQKVGTRGNVVMTALRQQQQDAQKATQLFSNALGVQVPRALESVISKSRVLGPLLAAAFDISIIGLFGAAILSQLPRLAAWIDKLRGINDELDKQVELAQKVNEIGLGDRSLKEVADQVAILTRRERELAPAVEAAERAYWTHNPWATATEEYKRNAAELEHVRGKLKDLIPELEKLNPKVVAAAEATRRQKQAEEQAAEETRKWAEHLRKLRAEFERGDFLRQRFPGWEKFVEEARRLRAARADEAIARINEELINGPLGDPNFDPGKVLAGIRQVLGQLPTALPPQGTKESADAIRQIEEQLAIDRARLEGRTIDAILIEEARRVEDTLKHLESIGASEAEMQRARETLAKQTEIKIAEENRRRVEEMAGVWDNFIDRVIFGAESWKDFFKGMLREMLATFLKFIGRMIIAWITGLEKMKDIWEAFKKSLPGGGGGGGAGTIIFNFLAGFQHGGLVDDVLRRAQAIHSADGRLLAMLHQGEAVLNPGAVRLMGAGRIEALNARGRSSSFGQRASGLGTPSFQGGGMVGEPGATTLNINFAPGSIISSASDPQRVAAEVIRAIRRRARDQGSRLPI